MKNRNSELALVSSWTPSQDPTVDPPAFVRWEDGSPGTITDYISHLDDTHKWVVDASEGIQRICYPSLTALVKFDDVAGVWAVSGRGVTPAALDLTDPDAPDDQIIAELYTFPMVYRAQIVRPPKNGVADASRRSTQRLKKSVSLYWIASLERRSDWLVFALTMAKAAAYHRQESNFTIDSRHCHRVFQQVNPFPFYSGEPPCYALNDDLEQLGFRVLDAPGGIQAVRLGITDFVLGYNFSAVPELRDDRTEAATGERPCGTIRNPPPLQF